MSLSEGTKNPAGTGFSHRIIPCLDVADGRTVKGVKFTSLRDVGDPVELGIRYQEQGADELMFLDISASVEGRKTMLDVVRQVARELSIPFSVGGGISQIEDVMRLLEAGADKVSVNTAAVKRPELIAEIAEACGSQCCVLAIDARRRISPSTLTPSPARGEGTSNLPKINNSEITSTEWAVLTHGGRQDSGMEAFAWGEEAVKLGAGEILLTSWDQDGTRAGFDLELTRRFAVGLPVPVIASGGADGPQSFIDVFTSGCADAALAASIFHDGHWAVNGLKEEIAKSGVSIRL